MSNYLPLGIRTILLRTGWTENETAVYSTLLEKGVMSLTTLSQETAIGTSTVQYALKQLLYKKMLTKTLVNNKPTYAASNIAQLRKWAKGFAQQFKDYELTMMEFIEQYDFHPQIFISSMKFYEGLAGVKQSYRDMLKKCNKETPIKCIFACSSEFPNDLKDFFTKEHTPKRIKKEIDISHIIFQNVKDEDLFYLKENKFEKKKILYTDEAGEINTEINVYRNYIHFMSCDKKSGFGFIIKDPQLACFFKIIFSFLWKIKS